jgi:hypothetical protein
MRRLFEIGFIRVGHWKIRDGQPFFELTRLMDEKRILYAFISDNEVKYIGKSIQSLNGRMYGYQRPGPTQKTNIKNLANIKAVLEQGKRVDIIAFRDNSLLHYGPFQINMAAALEDDLIAKLRPEWNGQSLPGTSIENVMNTSKADGDNFESNHEAASGINPDQESTDIDQKAHNPSFTLTVQKTYYNMGFFNVGVKYEKYFGNNGEKINIYCGVKKQLIIGSINRTANVNNTPRIMGTAALKEWFQENSKINGTIHIEIISPNSILISLS